MANYGEPSFQYIWEKIKELLAGEIDLTNINVNAAMSTANQAMTSATDAYSHAQDAETYANQALQAAQDAQGDATEAKRQAQNAATAAQTAWNWADDAHTAADTAYDWADEAKTQAGNALTQAQNAQASATHANASANGALTSLAVVEKVLDTLNWITEHGTYTLTTDTEIVDGKVYFVKDGDVYTPVAEPKAEELSTYYELFIDAAVSDYVASHLALTNDGLYVIKDSNSYKVLVANDGVKIYDSRGTLIATYGASIRFSDDVPQYIGGEDAYIVFDPITGSVTIGGTKVNFGSKTLSQVIASVENSITSVAIEYALGDDSTTAPSTGWSTGTPTWTTGKYIWQRTATTKNGTTTYSNVACIQGAKGEQGEQGIQGEQGAKGDTGDTGTSVSAITLYYKLDTSTPSVPTVKPPTGWSDTQPTLDLTKTCYVVVLTEYDNNTFSYSVVSTLSEYLASKEAIETANTAQETADANTNSINGKTYYQYTVNDYTYDVIYDEDNNRYYYINDNDEQVTVTYAQLDKDEDDVPITVIRGGLVNSIEENAGQISELDTTTQEALDSLNGDISKVAGDLATAEDTINGNIGRLNEVYDERVGKTETDIGDLDGRVSKNESDIGKNTSDISEAKKDITTIQNQIAPYDEFIEIHTASPASITLGKRTGENVKSKVVITTQDVQFWTDNKKTAVASGEVFQAPKGQFEQITMRTTNGDGQLRWIARSNGHLSLKKVEGN